MLKPSSVWLASADVLRVGVIRRLPAARDDLVAIWRYVARDSEAFADALIDRIDGKLRLLSDNPKLGRVRSELMAGLRSFAIGNYVVFYQPERDGIVVVRVLHGARDLAREVQGRRG